MTGPARRVSRSRAARPAGCVALGFGARELQKRPSTFLAAVGQLPRVTIVPVSGDVLIRDADRAILGVVDISGDASDQ